MPIFSLPTAASPSVTPSSETEIDLFGVDLLFQEDLQVTASSDYATVEGLAALKQAILVRLLTAPGEYAIRPGFGVGVGQWVKKRVTRADMDSLRQAIIDQLGQEDRITKVEEVTIDKLTTGNMTGIKIFIRVTALGRENSFAFGAFEE